MLAGAWESLERTIGVGVVPIDDEGYFTAQISRGSINLGAPNEPLFTIEALGDNKVRLHWKLDKLKVNLLIRTDFHIEILGIKIKKHEDFHISAGNITGATSILKLKFNNGSFSLEPLGTSGFKVRDLDIRSADDDFTTWVLNKVKFSVRSVLNSELSKYINGPEAINEIKRIANDSLSELENIDLKFSKYATDMKINFTQFDLEKKRIVISANAKFDQSSYELHSCATDVKGTFDGLTNLDSEMVMIKENLNNGSLLVPHTFINQIVKNLGMLRFDMDNDGVDDEPLFCSGYEDAEFSGDVKEIDFKVLGKNRKLHLRIWTRPEEVPIFSYSIGDDRKAYLNLEIRTNFKIVNDKGFPKLLFKNNQMSVKIQSKFEVSIVKGKGLMLRVGSVKMKRFQGKLYMKFSRFIPKIKVSFSKIKAKFENAIKEKLEKAVKDRILLEEFLPGPKMKMRLDSFNILENDHELKFVIEE